MNRLADRRRGLAVRKKLNGKRFGKVTGALAATMPDLEDFINEVLFGRIWARPGLDLRMRCATTIGALIALQRLPQLKAYIANALNIGLTRDEILEIIMHTVLYSGLPATANAIGVAREVFEEEGLAPPPPKRKAKR